MHVIRECNYFVHFWYFLHKFQVEIYFNNDYVKGTWDVVVCFHLQTYRKYVVFNDILVAVNNINNYYILIT